jgi:predicted transposase YbfD/YdcC
VVESQRCVDDEESTDYRYYIASLVENNVKLFADAVRSHWGVENSLHWVLDVAFREDDSRIRTANAQENFPLLRHIALNLLHQDNTAKLGIKIKRLSAKWDDRYLAKVLSGRPSSAFALITCSTESRERFQRMAPDL